MEKQDDTERRETQKRQRRITEGRQRNREGTRKIGIVPVKEEAKMLCNSSQRRGNFQKGHLSYPGLIN
jgi:hypothetical protein